MHYFIRYHKWKYIKENIYSNIKVLLHELLFFAARKKQVRDCLKYFVFDTNVCICANTTGIQCSENTTPAGGIKSHKANLQEEIRTVRLIRKTANSLCFRYVIALPINVIAVFWLSTIGFWLQWRTSAEIMQFGKSIIVKNDFAKGLCYVWKCEEEAGVVCVAFIVIFPFLFFFYRDFFFMCVLSLFLMICFRVHVFFCFPLYYVVSFFRMTANIIDFVIVSIDFLYYISLVFRF